MAGAVCPCWGANAKGKLGQRKVTDPAQHLPGGHLLPSRNGLAQSNVISGGWWPRPSSSVVSAGQKTKFPFQECELPRVWLKSDRPQERNRSIVMKEGNNSKHDVQKRHLRASNLFPVNAEEEK